MTAKAKPNPRRPKQKKPAEPPIKNKAGHPLAYPDMAQAMKLLGGLGSIMATWKEAAAVLGVTEKTLADIFKRWPEVKDAFESSKERGKVSLRRNQFKLSERNATMAIFLGLNYLDQRDLRNVNIGGTVEHQHLVMHTLLEEIDEESRGRPLIEHSPDEVVLGPDEEAA